MGAVCLVFKLTLLFSGAFVAGLDGASDLWEVLQFFCLLCSVSGGRIPQAHCRWEIQQSLICDFLNLPELAFFKEAGLQGASDNLRSLEQKLGALLWRFSSGS